MAKRKLHTVVKVEEILSGHSPEVRLLVERLRRIIRASVPEASESGHPVWHSIGYRHPRSGYFCGIFPHENRVDLAFEFGVLLPDPKGLLEGVGKQVRYLRLRQENDFQEAAIRELLRAAIDLPERRDVKLALVRAAVRPVQEKEGGN